jgi:P27 family predicted phage terminase small subunit
MAGRKPKPTALKDLAGTNRDDRANENEPQPERAIPACPKGLTSAAKKEWKRISKDLYALGLLSNIDQVTLAMYCQAWAHWLDAVEKLEKEGMIRYTEKGYPIQNPYFSIVNKSYQQIKGMLAEFGMSPASRSRISALPGDPDPDEKDEGKFFG